MITKDEMKQAIKWINEYDDNIDLMKDLQTESELLRLQLNKITKKMSVEQFTEFAQKTGYFDTENCQNLIIKDIIKR